MPLLIKCLQDDDETTQRNAAEALGNIGDRSALPSLIELEKDEDKWVNKEALDAIAKLGGR